MITYQVEARCEVNVSQPTMNRWCRVSVDDELRMCCETIGHSAGLFFFVFSSGLDVVDCLFSCAMLGEEKLGFHFQNSTRFIDS